MLPICLTALARKTSLVPLATPMDECPGNLTAHVSTNFFSNATNIHNMDESKYVDFTTINEMSSR